MTFNINAQVRLLPPTNAAQIAANLRAQLQGINATVNINVPPQAARALNNARTSMDKTRASAKGAADATKNFGEAMAYAGKRFFAFTVATSVILKFANAIKEGTRDAIGFQRELVKISQVTGNTLSDLKNLTKEITRLSTTLGTSSNQLLKASRILAQTGLTAKQTETALQALAKSDLAPTFDDIISTTEGSIAIFRQFGIQAKQLEGALGSINAVAGKFAVESSDIITAVRRTGGAFAAAGGSLNELIALFTSVRATTRESAESIATGFRTIFTRLQRVRTQNFLETLGIDLRDIEGQFVGPLEAIRKLSIALKSLPSTDPRFAQIIEELGGFRQVSKVIPLIQQFGTAERALGVAMAGTNSLTQDAETAQQALAVQIQKTREEFTAMIRSFTDTATFKATIMLMLNLARAIIRVTEALKPLTPLIGVLAAFTAARIVPSIYSGFKEKGGFGFFGLTGKHDGGQVKKFARGGIVPGVGNKDTVPAQLTPGEYVLRKSAVQKIGKEHLQYLNSGGVAKRNFGAIFPFIADKSGRNTAYKPQVTTTNVQKALPADKRKQGYRVTYNGQPTGSVQYDMPFGFVDAAAAKILDTDAKVVVNDALTRISKTLMPDAKIDVGTKVPNLPAIQGALFEGAVARLGSPFGKGDHDDTRTFDFPQGIKGNALKLFNNPRLANTPVDAKGGENRTGILSKATSNEPGGLKFKAINYIVDRIVNGNRTYEGFKLEGPPQKAAAGGSISQPNAMLTPGEVVISRDDAARIGESNLDFINRTGTIPGFAGGGSYGRVFKPQLTGRGIAEGNVGRKKQYYAQLIAYLEKGKAQGILSPQELQMLHQLRARVSTIQQSRTKRFSKRLGFAKGGAFGRIRGYAGGGLVGSAGSNITQFANLGFALAAVGQLATTFKGLNDTLDKVIDGGLGMAAQFGLLIYAIRSATDYVGRFGSKIQQAEARTAELRAQYSPEGRASIAAKAARRRSKADAAKAAYAAQVTGGGPVDPKVRRRAMVTSQLASATEKQRDSLRSQIKEQSRAISANQRLQRQANLAAGGLALFGSALIAVGGQLTKAGEAQIQRGGGRGKFIAGRVTTGAGQGLVGGGLAGAAIGSIVPVIGTAVGAVVGAALGGLGGAGFGAFTSGKAAFNIEAIRDFNKGLEETDRVFKAIQGNQTDYTTQSAFIAAKLRDTRKTLSEKSLTDESRQDITSGIKGQLDGFRGYLDFAAKSSKDFGDFLARVGPQVFEDFSDLAGIPYSELVNTYTVQIQRMNESNAKLKSNSELQDKLNSQIRTVVNLGRAFNDVSLKMKSLSGELSVLSGFAQGGAAALSAFDESDRLANPQDFFDSARFTDLVARNITNNPALQTKFPGATDNIGAEFGANLIDAEAAVNKLPSVLLKLRNSIGEFDPETAVDKLLEEFKDAGPLVQDAIRVAANNIIGTEGKEEKLIKEIQDNLLGVADKLAEGFKPTFETAGKIAKAMAEEENRRLEFVAQITSLTEREISLRNAGADILEQRERLLSRASNRPADLNRLQQIDTQRLTNIGGGTDPRVIGNNLQTAQNKLLSIQQKLAEGKIKVDKKLTDEITKQQNVVTRSTKALEFLSDVSGRTSVTLEKLDRAQAAATFKQGLLERAASIESPEEGRNFALELRNARVAAAAGSVRGIDPQFRSEVVSLFKGLGDAKLEVFGGKSGTDIFQSILSDIAQQAGFNKADADKLAAGQSSETEKLRAALSEQIEAARQANEELQKNLESNVDKLVKGLDESIVKFGKELSDIIKAQKVQEFAGKLAGAQGNRANVATSQANLQEFINRFGSEANAFKVGENLPLIQEIAKMAEAADKFTTLVKDSDKIADDKFVFGTNTLGKQIREVVGPGRELDRSAIETIKDGIAAAVTAKTGDANIGKEVALAIGQRVRFNADGETNTNALLNLIPEALNEVSTRLKPLFEGRGAKNQQLTTNLGFSISDVDFDWLTGADAATAEARAKAVKAIQEQYETFRQFREATADTADGMEGIDQKMEKFDEAIRIATEGLKNLGVPVGDNNQRGGPIRFAKGGVVPGRGNKDSVLGLLTPGEVVLPKFATGGGIYASHVRRQGLYGTDPEEFTEKEKKFQAAREKRKAERAKRLGREYVPVTDQQREKNARRARAIAQGKTSFQVYVEDKTAEFKTTASNLAGRAKDYVVEQYNSLKEKMAELVGPIPSPAAAPPLPTPTAPPMVPPDKAEPDLSTYEGRRANQKKIEELVRSGKVTKDNVYSYFRGRADKTGYNADLYYAKAILGDVSREREAAKSPAQRAVEAKIRQGVAAAAGRVGAATAYADKVIKGISDIPDDVIKKIQSDSEYPIGYFKLGDSRNQYVNRLYEAGKLSDRQFQNIISDLEPQVRAQQQRAEAQRIRNMSTSEKVFGVLGAGIKVPGVVFNELVAKPFAEAEEMGGVVGGVAKGYNMAGRGVRNVTGAAIGGVKVVGYGGVAGLAGIGELAGSETSGGVRKRFGSLAGATASDVRGYVTAGYAGTSGAEAEQLAGGVGYSEGFTDAQKTKAEVLGFGLDTAIGFGFAPGANQAASTNIVGRGINATGRFAGAAADAPFKYGKAGATKVRSAFGTAKAAAAEEAAAAARATRSAARRSTEGTYRYFEKRAQKSAVNKARQAQAQADEALNKAAQARAAEGAKKSFDPDLLTQASPAQAAKAQAAAEEAVKSATKVQFTRGDLKRTLDAIRLAKRAAGTAEGGAAQGVAKSLGRKFGLTNDQITNMAKLSEEISNAQTRLSAYKAANKPGQVARYTEKIATLESRLDDLIAGVNKTNGLQRGAFIPGIGSGDKVHAMLEPGEYVLNRNAVRAAGAHNIDRFNKKHARFQTGGMVGLQEGGGVAQMAMPDFTFFNEIVQKFGNKVDLLAESVNNINGMEIQLVASHKVEVIINGAQVMQSLMPSIQNMIVAETNKAINTMLKSKFPDVGTME